MRGTLLAGAWLSLAAAAGATPLRMTLSAAGEQFHELAGHQPVARSAVTAGLRLVYDDPLGLHLVGDVRWHADRILPERDRIEVAEGFVGLAAGPFEIDAGWQHLRWGRLDTLRPTDLFRRRDLIDPLEDRDEPIGALRIALFAGAATLEAIWVPVFTPDRLSFDERNPWCLFPDSVVAPAFGAFAAEFERGRRTDPPDDLTSSEGGLRLDLHAGAWDLGLCAARAHDRLPTVVAAVETTFTADEHVRLRVDLAHAPLLMAGADLARTCGPGTLRLEAAHVRPEEVAGHAAERPYLQAGIGLDRALPAAIPGLPWTIFLQYSYDEAGHGAEELDFARYRHLLRHGGFARLRLQPGRFTRIDLETLVDLEYGDRFLRAELSVAAPAGIGLTADLLLVDGSRQRALGRFREHDRIGIELSYAWSRP